MKTETADAATTGDLLDAALGLDLLDDVDADYGFFFGLFDERLQSDDATNGDATTADSSDASTRPSSSSHLASSVRSDRLRQRWSAPPDMPDHSVVIRLPAPPIVESCPNKSAQETLARAWEGIVKTKELIMTHAVAEPR